MLDLFLSSLRAIKNFTGLKLLFVLVMLAWIVLFLREHKRSLKADFVVMPLIVMLFFICPITPFIFTKAGLDADIYYRLMWMIPFGMITVYAIVKLIGRNWKSRMLGGIIAALVIAFSGQCIYTSPIFFKTENAYGLPQQTIDIVDYISNDAGHSFISILPSADLITTIRQYDASIRMPYGRDTFTHTYVIPNPVYMAFEKSEKLNFAEVLKVSRDYEIEYFVIHAARLLDDDPEEAGLVYVGCVDDHLIYRDPVITDLVRLAETYYDF